MTAIDFVKLCKTAFLSASALLLPYINSFISIMITIMMMIFIIIILLLLKSGEQLNI